MEIVNLGEKFARIHDYWNPRIAGELNDSYVKLVKLEPGPHRTRGTSWRNGP